MEGEVCLKDTIRTPGIRKRRDCYGIGRREDTGKMDLLTKVGLGWREFSHAAKRNEWVCFQRENEALEKNHAILVKES